MSEVAPRHLTPMPAGALTYGPAICAVSKLLGRPVMPWQRSAADLIGAFDPATGRPSYPLVVITVQRQAGKSALTLAAGVQRCTLPGTRAWFTAQTGGDAREHFLSLVDGAEAARSPLTRLWEAKRANARTLLQFRNGSTFRAHPPTVDALHGTQSDLNLIDEAWSFTPAEGDALLQAITPTQSTRPRAQTIILSTVGDASSSWFHGLVDKASDGHPGIAIVDYGIGDDVDPTDIDAVAAAHPAVGRTIDREFLASALAQLGPAGFARAFGNRRTATRETLLPVHVIDSVTTGRDIPASVPVALGAAVSIDRSHVAIAAAATVDGIPMIEVVHCRPGTSWAAGECMALARSTSSPITLDPRGPSGSLADELTLMSVDVAGVTLSDYGSACSQLWDRMHTVPATVMLREHPALMAAMSSAAWRHIGDTRVWGRRNSTPFAALEAATMAMWGLARLPAPAVAPLIIAGA